MGGISCMLLRLPVFAGGMAAIVCSGIGMLHWLSVIECTLGMSLII